jgi:dienelactone hydrolase
MFKDNTRIEKKIYTTVVFLLMIFFGLYETSISGELQDVNQTGPYAVGHSWYIFEDDSRCVTDDDSEPWPVPVYIFYPVDPEAIGESTPKAIYHLDVDQDDVYHLDYTFGPWDPIPSIFWEGFGCEPAYQDPPGSNDGPFPLIMLSHGGGCTGQQMFYLGLRLASHGFTVAIIHHYSDWPPLFNSDHSVLVYRTADISFALSKLLEMNGTEGEILHNVIDPNKVAAAGFSYGGTTSLALVSGVDDVCWWDNLLYELGIVDYPPDYICEAIDIDPRIKAVVSLDGGDFIFRLHELNRITVPVLSIGQDWENLGDFFKMPGFRSRLHAATSQAHPSYRIDIRGATHGTFGNPPQYPEAKRIITKYMIAFLKTNLSGESGYQRILTPGHAIKQESVVEFFVTEKRSLNGEYDEEFPDVFNYDSDIYFVYQPGSEKAKAYKDSE